MAEEKERTLEEGEERKIEESEKKKEEVEQAGEKEEKGKEKPFEKPKTLLSWSAPGRVHEEKSKLWFLGLLVLVLLLGGIVYLLTEDIFTVLVVLSGGFAFFAISAVRPREVIYYLQNNGIVVPGRTFLWEELDSFWIHREEGREILSVRTNLGFPSILEILLEGVNSEEVEKTLLKYLPYGREKRRDYFKFVDATASEISRRLAKVRKPSLPFKKKTATS